MQVRRGRAHSGSAPSSYPLLDRCWIELTCCQKVGWVSGYGFRCQRGAVGRRRRCRCRVGVRWCRCLSTSDGGRDGAVAADWRQMGRRRWLWPRFESLAGHQADGNGGGRWSPGSRITVGPHSVPLKWPGPLPQLRVLRESRRREVRAEEGHSLWASPPGPRDQVGHTRHGRQRPVAVRALVRAASGSGWAGAQGHQSVRPARFRGRRGASGRRGRSGAGCPRCSGSGGCARS